MRKILLLASLALAACSTTPSYRLRQMAEKPGHVYMQVENFDGDWASLQDSLTYYAEGAAGPDEAVMVHALDTLLTSAPKSGMYGGEAVQKHVLAQAVKPVGATEVQFFKNPFAQARFE